MANRYQTISEDDLGNGIDNQSPENRIPAGYVQDLVNADPKSTGQIKTRKGYQGFAGNVPFRVNNVDYNGTDLCLTLDSSVDLTGNRPSAIIVAGRTSGQNGSNAGDFPNDADAEAWYDTFNLDIKKTFTALTTSTVSIPQSEHGFSTDKLVIQVYESTSAADNSNSYIEINEITVDSSSYDITLSYTNATASDVDVFVAISDRSTVGTGINHIETDTVPASSLHTTTITSATHNLDNFNIIASVYEDTGSALKRIIPDQVEIDSLGTVSVSFINNTVSPVSILIILSSVASSNVIQGVIAASSTDSITISGLATSFPYTGVYLEDAGTGDLDQVIPNSIVTDASNNQVTIEFINGTPSALNFEIYYDALSVVGNRVCITANSSATYIDSEPQLTIWGIPHNEAYGSERSPREGWVNHIDSYRSASANLLVSGLGGNLYQAISSGITVQPTYFPDISNRISTDTTVGPTFVDTSDTSTRTRGYIQADNASQGFITIDSASYNGGTGYVDYVFNAPGITVNGTLSTIINTTTALSDQLTVQQMGHSKLNGTFDIRAVTTGVDTMTVSVVNGNIDSSDFDEVDAGGKGGIFTDHVPLSTTSKFLVDDVMAAGSLLDNQILIRSSGSTIGINNVVDILALSAGLRIAATRTGSIIPLRDLTRTATIEDIVRGDMLTYTPLNRQLRAVYLNPQADITLAITSDGTTATAVLASGDTVGFTIGQKLLITGSSSYSGEQTITAIPSDTSFSFASTGTASEAATLIGKTIEIDESGLSIQDKADSSNTVAVAARWEPIELPTDSFDITPKTAVQHFDSSTYTNQEILRSTMVKDNLYLTNGNDEVFKYDGVTLYRAGLFRWQPHLFLTQDDNSTGKIVLNNPSISFSAISSNIFTVTAGDELAFQAGDIIETSTDGEQYTVITNSSGAITVDRSISGGGSGTLILTSTFKYYFRLNAIDANDNITTSAVVGIDDNVIRIADDTAIRLRLVGMPIWHYYDYDRIEVQIYRTRANTNAPFYLLTTLALDFDNDAGYLDYIDTASDEDLITLDNTLPDTSIGTGITEPVRAKYVTSGDNRLILSNLTDYPQMDLRWVRNGSGPIDTAALTAAGNSLYLFRKDNTDTGTVTNMTDRATYEFVDTSAAVTITPLSDITVSSTDVININSTTHGLAVGDWIYLYHSAVATTHLLNHSGWFQISEVPDADNFRFKLAGAVAGTVNDVDRYITATVTTDIPVLLGTDGNYGMLNGNRDSGAGDPYEFLAARRLANAINTSMRVTDLGISGQSTFEPWMIASAGNEFNIGQLLIRRPRVDTTSTELQLPALTGAFDLFINDIKRVASTSAGTIERVFPSRSIMSLANFPEMFDRPTVQLDLDSTSAIDINSADGQEITASIPFFGESAFRAALKDSIIVIFKTNSIYLFNIANKAAGNAETIQRLESAGKGCTAPYSVAVTRAGIMFANLSGIYRLGRDMQIDYIGRRVERIWQEELNNSQLDIATGHFFPKDNQYKLSFPNGTGQTENNQVLVYNTVREYETKTGDGSWTTYTNHDTTGWANLQDDSYFGTTQGQVYIIRQLNEDSDYRDDSTAIPVRILTRPIDFGDSSIRKVIGQVVTHYRTLVQSDNITLKSGMDFLEQLQTTDTFKVNQTTASTGLTDVVGRTVQSISSSLQDRTGIYLQLEYTVTALDEPIELAGIDIRVAGLSEDGIQQAAQTTDNQ